MSYACFPSQSSESWAQRGAQSGSPTAQPDVEAAFRRACCVSQLVSMVLLPGMTSPLPPVQRLRVHTRAQERALGCSGTVARPPAHWALRLAQHTPSMPSARPGGSSCGEPREELGRTSLQLPRLPSGAGTRAVGARRLPPSHEDHTTGQRKDAMWAKEQKANTLPAGRGSQRTPNPYSTSCGMFGANDD